MKKVDFSPLSGQDIDVDTFDWMQQSVSEAIKRLMPSGCVALSGCVLDIDTLVISNGVLCIDGEPMQFTGGSVSGGHSGILVSKHYSAEGPYADLRYTNKATLTSAATTYSVDDIVEYANGLMASSNPGLWDTDLLTFPISTKILSMSGNYRADERIKEVEVVGQISVDNLNISGGSEWIRLFALADSIHRPKLAIPFMATTKLGATDRQEAVGSGYLRETIGEVRTDGDVYVRCIKAAGSSPYTLHFYFKYSYFK
jgi:hypothetical protein